MIPDYNNRALPAVPPRPPGSPALPPGGQGWATNVPVPTPANSDEDRVMRLEQTAFGSTYPEHEVEDRVDHLEKEVLGGKSDGSMSDRIAKLEAKLGGAGAFGHTNTPGASTPSSSLPASGLPSSSLPASGRPSLPVSGTPLSSMPPSTVPSSAPTLSDVGPADADHASGDRGSQSQVPFPAAQDEQQPLAAVAQSLTGPTPGQGLSAVPPQNQPSQSKPPLGMPPQSKPPQGQPPQSKPPQSKPPQGKPSQSKPPLSKPPQGQPPLSEPAPGTPPTGAPLPHVPVTSPLEPIPLPQSSKASANQPPAPVRGSGAHPSRNSAAHQPKNAVNPPEVQAVVDTIPFDAKAGDYFAAVKKFDGDTVARWTSFPITLKLPAESPDSWKKNLHFGITEWNRYIPLQTVTGTENCDVEVSWVNKLLPGVLGVTRLTTPKKGSIHVEIWLLRPTFYPPDVPEHALQVAFLHELGHAIGIFGHSSGQDDLMASAELSLAVKGKASAKSLTVEPKDLNTLKQIYSAPALPNSFMLPVPLEWSLSPRH